MLKKYLKDFVDDLKDFLLYEYKYLVMLLLVVMVCYFPLNYYIIIGGGISDIASRVEVQNKAESKGSFNISYVTEADGTILTYLLSLVMPGWEREDVNDYKYNENESIKDINFRNDLSLTKANSDATYVAYNKAKKDITLKSSKFYVISKMEDKEECKLNVGDQLLEINNQDINKIDYTSYINSLNEGDFVTVKVIRNNKEQDIKTKLYKEDNRLLMGIYLTQLKEYKTSPKVELKFKKSESGPSAGLMTALSIYNQLVSEDITKGLTIAGTGTIDSEGNVGEIGGVEYKVLGAAKGKADVFIVPVGNNYKTVKKTVKEKKLKIKVIAVSTFDEALRELSKLKG